MSTDSSSAKSTYKHTHKIHINWWTKKTKKKRFIYRLKKLKNPIC